MNGLVMRAEELDRHWAGRPADEWCVLVLAGGVGRNGPPARWQLGPRYLDGPDARASVDLYAAGECPALACRFLEHPAFLASLNGS